MHFLCDWHIWLILLFIILLFIIVKWRKFEMMTSMIEINNFSNNSKKFTLTYTESGIKYFLGTIPVPTCNEYDTQHDCSGILLSAIQQPTQITQSFMDSTKFKLRNGLTQNKFGLVINKLYMIPTLSLVPPFNNRICLLNDPPSKSKYFESFMFDIKSDGTVNIKFVNEDTKKTYYLSRIPSTCGLIRIGLSENPSNAITFNINQM